MSWMELECVSWKIAIGGAPLMKGLDCHTGKGEKPQNHFRTLLVQYTIYLKIGPTSLSPSFLPGPSKFFKGCFSTCSFFKIINVRMCWKKSICNHFDIQYFIVSASPFHFQISNGILCAFVWFSKFFLHSDRKQPLHSNRTDSGTIFYLHNHHSS